MRDIYVCRHGRTALNAAGLLRGRLDPDLDVIGQAEARKLADELGRVGLTRVISSPLARAMQTAAPLAAAADIAVEADDRLLDRAYGTFDGTPAASILADYGSFDAAPGVEPTARVVERAMAVLSELIDSPGPGPVALVSHDAVIRLLIHTLAPTARSEQGRLGTGCWSVLRLDESGWRLSDSNEGPFAGEIGRAHV